jgi:3',5'-cyclic AMP phosphodiesterase CpdA
VRVAEVAREPLAPLRIVPAVTEAPYLLVQLSDLHVGSNWNGVDPVLRLERAIDAVLGLPNPVGAVLVSGDLAGNGRAEEYAIVRQQLGRLDVPVHVVPGNHDDRALLRAALALPGDPAAPIDFAVDAGPLRLVGLDSTVPGQDPGEISLEQLAWLDACLAEHPTRPTLIAMHHPPLATAIPDWDGVNLVAPQRRPLAAVVERHPQVRALVGGHLHRIAAGSLAGRPVLSAPSTYLQARPDFLSEEVEMDGEPPAFALHVWRDGELSSQIETVPV